MLNFSLMLMGLELDNWGIWLKLSERLSRTLRTTSSNVKSSAVSWWSAYNTWRNADVHAPPAFPAGSGRRKLATLLTSAEVCSSRQPDIRRTSAGISFSACSKTVDMVVSLLSVFSNNERGGVCSYSRICLLSHRVEILKGDSFVSLGKNRRIMTHYDPTRLLKTFTLMKTKHISTASEWVGISATAVQLQLLVATGSYLSYY